MAGVQDTTRIDLVGRSADGEVMLFIVEDRPWDADPCQFDDLPKKLETYATFVVNGQLAQQYPDYRDHPVRIQIDCPEEPTPPIRKLIDTVTASFARLNIKVVLNVRGY